MADSECYSRALSDETRSGPRIATFLGSDFFGTRLAEFHPCKALLPSGEDGGGLGEPCAAAVCAPGALHRHLRSLRTRALVALSWPGPNLPISAQSRRCLADNLSALVRTLPAKRLSFAIIATRCAAKKVPAKARLPSARAACLHALRSD